MNDKIIKPFTPKLYQLDDRLNFGKHNGKLVLTLVDEDPEYLIWAHRNVGFFELEATIYKSLLEDVEGDEGDNQDDREDDDLLKQCYSD